VNDQPLIEIKGLTKTYQAGAASVQALRSVDLRIQPGEFVAIMGMSGSGKSTLMNLLGCLDTPTAGTYHLGGQDVSRLTQQEYAAVRNKQIGFVFQGFNLLPRTSALENVMLPLVYDRAGQEPNPRQAAVAALERVGLADRLHHDPNQLSGGQQQRVALARAMVNRPAIILADEPTGNLDTKTSAEIMTLLQELNRGGLTLLLVTHATEMAAYAARIVTLSDGLVQSDQPVQQRRGGASAPEPAPASTAATPRARGSVGMLANLLKASFRALFKNKLRSLLTSLGIIIGVSGVIVMSAVGQGTQAMILKQISALGNNVIIVFPSASRSGNVSRGAGSFNKLTMDDISQLERDAKLLTAVSPIVRTPSQIVGGGKNWATEISGVTPAFFTMKSWRPLYGSLFTKADVNGKRKVAVLGKTVADELFPNQDPTGKKVLIGNIPFTVVGVLKSKGQSGLGQDQDDLIVAPATTVLYRLKGGRYIDLINASAVSAGKLDDAEDEIKTILRAAHRLESKTSDDFTIQNQAEIVSTAKTATSIMTVFLGAIASISLVVGGIGIMNIMLVSVTERTREIGIRRSVGARGTDILFQFLAEATVLSVTGGLIGILLAFAMVQGVNSFTSYYALIQTPIICIAVLFSAAIGIAFGFFPARKAAGLNPIDALRYE
jgi:macrolide transport system ATP-binding/permease protein